METSRPYRLAITAVTQKGKSYPIEIEMAQGVDLIASAHAALAAKGLAESERANLILLPAAHELSALAGTSGYPTLPKPASKDDMPPDTSEAVLVQASDVELFLYFWGDDGENSGAYFPVKGSVTNPPFPSGAKIAYKRYWKNCGSYRIGGPQDFSREVTTTEGMSKTDTTTLSAELGVAAEGLSAKLTATTSTSITISEETSLKETYSIKVEDGKVCVYTIWQLIEAFELVDSANNPISWRGKFSPPGVGSLLGAFFPAKFPTNSFTHNTKRYASDPVMFNA